MADGPSSQASFVHEFKVDVNENSDNFNSLENNQKEEFQSLITRDGTGAGNVNRTTYNHSSCKYPPSS